MPARILGTLLIFVFRWIQAINLHAKILVSASLKIETLSVHFEARNPSQPQWFVLELKDVNMHWLTRLPKNYTK
jgi:hypothetical protein